MKYNELLIEALKDPHNYYDQERLKAHHHEGDVGFDLFVPERVVIPTGALNMKIGMGIKCAMYEVKVENETTRFYTETEGYMLALRSSTPKLGLRQSNSIGIIDAGYRGEILLPVDNVAGKPIAIEAGTRLCQLVSFNGKNILPIVVDELDNTSRGEGGFGSTGQGGK